MSGTQPTPPELLEAIEELYISLEQNFDRMVEQCETVEQRRTAEEMYWSGRKAFWAAQNVALRDNNLVVAQMYRDLKHTTQQVRNSLGQIQQIDELLRLIGDAVRLAGAIVALAAT